MKLSEIKNLLIGLQKNKFKLPNSTKVPEHFHVIEVGEITKKFIDCSRTVRKEKVIDFQLWDANDFDHCFTPQKLLSIIELFQKYLNQGDYKIEVKFHAKTISKYALEFDSIKFYQNQNITVV